MQEVFESLVKDTVDMYEDAIRHTDVMKLYNDLRIQKACADAQIGRIKNELDKPGVIDEECEESLWVELTEFETESRTFKYVIDVIESGKFVGE
jgi:hypothetical protein